MSDRSSPSTVRSAASSLRAYGGALRRRFEGPNTYGNSLPFWAVFAVFVGCLAVFPQVANELDVLLVTDYLALTFLALSLCFIWGYCGVLSFGQVAFFGVAGYAYGLFAINFGSALGTTAAVPVAILIGTVFALLLGYFMFYGGVRDVYVTITTLVVVLVLNTFLSQTGGSEWAIGEAQLGGHNGIHMPDIVLGTAGSNVVFEGTTAYYALVVAVLLTYLGLRALVNSSFGLTMVAIREDEDRTAAFGYDVKFVKLLVFTVGGALAAVGGVLYAGTNNFMSPDEFAVTAAALPVVWVSIGGRDSLLGAILATLAIERFQTALAFTGSEWALVFLGGSLLLVIMVVPSGIVPQLDTLGKWLLARAPDPSESRIAEKLRNDTEEIDR